MLLILPVALYLLGSLSSIILRWWRPKFRYGWLISLLIALFVVGITFIWRLQLPLLVELTSWRLPGFEPLAISLLVDDISWGFAVSVAVLVLTALIADTLYEKPSTDPAPDGSDWPIAIGLAGLALIPLLAENTITLLVGWALLDIVEFGVRLKSSRDSSDYRRAQYFISTRLASQILVISAIVFLRAVPASDAIETGSSVGNFFLLAAAALRLWSTPGILPKLPSNTFQRPLDALLILSASASSLMLVARLASMVITDVYPLWLYLLVGIIGVLLVLAWLIGRADSNKAHLLFGGLASLALAAMIGAQANAAFAWGIAALLISAMVFLYIAGLRWSYAVIFLGWIGISSLPVTPAWAGVSVYSTGLAGTAVLIVVVLLLTTQAASLAGVLVALRRPRSRSDVQERWAGIAYPLGILLIPATQWLIFAFNFSSLQQNRTWSELLQLSWPAFVAVGLSFLVYLVFRRVGKYELESVAYLRNFFSLSWLRSMFESIYQAIKGLFAFIDAIVDGQGGILWTFLFLMLLFALLIQLQGGS